MKLTYWVSRPQNDSPVYSVRTKTKKECKSILKSFYSDDYSKPKQVTVEYLDGFDLMKMCCDEGGSYWEV